MDRNEGLSSVCKKATLELKYISKSGSYILGYFSYVSQQLVGLSREFGVNKELN